MNLSHKPQRKKDFRLEQIDDELLLYHPGQTNILYCNQTASLVWQLCDGQQTGEAIIKLLSEAYSEHNDTLKSDVEAVLQQFLDNNAIEFRPA